MNRYTMIIQWSDEDQLFLVTIPEFADRVIMPYTHGKTREEAIQNGEEVIEMYLSDSPEVKLLAAQLSEKSPGISDRRLTNPLHFFFSN
ncbi:MAG: type II toxin-antitoxin system HicB family antitoxin [Nostoc sp.]|uniref:type II toxin-antitoxin system HicB family antitoxin n=1 Tax=Nostoc sp. TaxID=1180 RepID=UPI002FF7F242